MTCEEQNSFKSSMLYLTLWNLNKRLGNWENWKPSKWPKKPPTLASLIKSHHHCPSNLLAWRNVSREKVIEIPQFSRQKVLQVDLKTLCSLKERIMNHDWVKSSRHWYTTSTSGKFQRSRRNLCWHLIRQCESKQSLHLHFFSQQKQKFKQASLSHLNASRTCSNLLGPYGTACSLVADLPQFLRGKPMSDLQDCHAWFWLTQSILFFTLIIHLNRTMATLTTHIWGEGSTKVTLQVGNWSDLPFKRESW